MIQFIKVSHERDLYLAWSSQTQTPVGHFTHDELRDFLNTPRRGEVWMTTDAIETLLFNAEITGSSAAQPFGCTFESEDIPFATDGVIPREKLGELADRFYALVQSGGGDLDLNGILIPYGD